MVTQPIDDAAEPAREAIELAAGHWREERTCERFVILLELGDERLAARGEGH
jgi:hypothetical protein